MPFWTAPNGALDSVTDQITQKPEYVDTFDAISELRNVHEEHPGRVSRHDGWLRVASVQGPLLDLARVIDPDFLQDKRKFYKWLDAHPEYATYDRRRGRRA